MSIRAHIFITLVLFVLNLVFNQRGAGFIGRLKNEYHALTVVNLLGQFLVVVLYILEGFMLFNIIIDFDQIYEKELMGK